MTEYNQKEDRITDILDTHGIVTQAWYEATGTEPDWVSALSPRVLRQTAELIEFCFPNQRVVDVGFIESASNHNNAKTLVVGNAEDNRHILAACRSDGYVNRTPVARDYLSA